MYRHFCRNTGLFANIQGACTDMQGLSTDTRASFTDIQGSFVDIQIEMTNFSWELKIWKFAAKLKTCFLKSSRRVPAKASRRRARCMGALSVPHRRTSWLTLLWLLRKKWSNSFAGSSMCLIILRIMHQTSAYTWIHPTSAFLFSEVCKCFQ